MPGLNCTQVSARDINVTTRERHRHAGHRSAGAARRPQPLPGLLRLRDVGLPAGQPERDQADRGHPRTGVGCLGRQRVQRRRQRHQQVAARDPGHQRRPSVSARSNRSVNGDDRRQRLAGLLQRHARAGHQRSLGVQAVGRRIFAGRAAAADRADSRRLPPPGTPYPAFKNTGTTQPKLDGRVDYDFEDGRKLSFSGGVAGTEGIMHTGIGPFDINQGSTMGYGEGQFHAQGASRASFFTNVLDGNASNLLTRDVNFQPIAFDFQTKTYDFEVTNVQRDRASATFSATAATCASTTSICRWRRTADNRTEFGVYGQDEIFLSDHFRWIVGARVDRFDYVDDCRVLAAHDVHDQAERAACVPAVVQPRLSLAVGHQQLPRRHRGRAGQPRGVQSRARRPDLPVADPLGRQPGSDREKLDAYEIGYTGFVARPRHALGRLLRQQGEEQTSSSAK